jgi:hypothetical protein
MARKMLKIEIKCGDTTCASEPGEFCKFFSTIRFGTVPVCRLFPSRDDSLTELKTSGDDQSGWVLRCEACLKQES